MQDESVNSEQPAQEQVAFDFERLRREAAESYQKVRDVYHRYAEVVKQILEAAFDANSVVYHEIEARAKDVDSFAKKACKALDAAATQPKYKDPLRQITDLAGVRAIVFFPKTLKEVDICIGDNFVVIERSDKSEQLQEEGRFGYKSIHYLVKMLPGRLALPEYARFTDLVSEIQARTILQHAWAEMEHDIQYKSVDVIPLSIKRRFIALAGMLEIADREFQTIQDEDEQLRATARTSVQEGRLADAELTPDALKSYLDRTLGYDGRMREWSYNFQARVLKKLGFRNLQQVDECVRGFSGDQLSRLVWGTRQGQISRFDHMLLAGMSENYIQRHPWNNSEVTWWVPRCRAHLDKMKLAGITVREYNPPPTESD